MIIDLTDMKAHLGIVDDADDALLTNKIKAAQAHVETFVGGDLDDEAPEPLKEAVRQLAGHLFENREATIIDGTVRPIPLGFHDLISPYRLWSF